MSTQDISYAIKILGDAYTLSIIRELSEKGKRFTELQRSLPDICPATLTDRLKKLEHEKLVVRKKETVDKLSVVYDLTRKGKGVLPIIREIGIFAEKYV